jgi:hypothetical protein
MLEKNTMLQKLTMEARKKLPSPLKHLLSRIRWASLHLSSIYGGFSNQAVFEDVETYCMFLGYPRSGHSLIGSLIDAHPNAIIAHELDALMYIKNGFRKSQLFYQILKNSQRFAKTSRVWTGYSYEVSEQWQGRFSSLKVIGDKKGGKSTFHLQSHPNLLSQLRNTVKLDIKYIHVTRNPFDNISTISRKSRFNFKESIDYYFSLCSTNQTVKNQLVADDVLDIRLESIIADPQNSMRTILKFLGLSAPKNYIESCASIIFDKPKKTRQEGPWTPDLIKSTTRKIEDYTFLSGYTYDD